MAIAVTVQNEGTSDAAGSKLPGTDGTKAPRGAERRRERRFPYQTVVTLVRVQTGTDFELRKCWTRDLSPGGARIMSREPIEGSRLLLKFLLPRLGSKFIEAQICSRTTERHTDIRNRSTEMFLYGVRFTSVLSEEDACDQILETGV
ncbi:PilZ domain protein [Caulifigura coniformis]|uniref:PilZ domain protein n=2 Tax=Caulifigura coniformis TaxID=2527983 RepID=A0A517SLD3_9PLAN|nr:PilZ domain protein [Caulifigura coniformis]